MTTRDNTNHGEKVFNNLVIIWFN